jgi:hypothetical protein
MTSAPPSRKGRCDPRDLMWTRVCSVDSHIVVPDNSLIAPLFASWLPNTTSDDLRIKLMSVNPSSDSPWELGPVDPTGWGDS